MTSINPLPKKIALIEDLKDLPARIEAFHVCEKSYLLAGPEAEVENFLRSSPHVPSISCEYPTDPWRTEYKYLGDVHIERPFCFDLRLRESEGVEYELNSPLPAGCRFEQGLLLGSASEVTPILNLKISAYHGAVTASTVYQIRFYDKINRAKSFTHDNYLKFGYGDELVDYAPELPYFRLFESSGKNVASPLEEAAQAARKIREAARGRRIFLFVSGGIDSQSMVQSFLKAGVEFEAVLMNDIRSCNAEDVHYARRFFDKIKRPLTVYPVDFASHIRSYRYVDMANRYRFNNPEYAILLHLMDRFDGYPVYAGRPVSVGRARTGESVVGLAADETWSRSRFMERTNRDGCPEFLIHTVELMESFLQLPFMRDFPRDRHWIYAHKLELLRQAGFDVSLAPPVKLTGFERLEDQFANSQFGNDLWLHHRGPLKYRYPHGKLRNSIPFINGRIGPSTPALLKPYEDGFSFKYLEKNDLAQYH